MHIITVHHTVCVGNGLESVWEGQRHRGKCKEEEEDHRQINMTDDKQERQQHNNVTSGFISRKLCDSQVTQLLVNIVFQFLSFTFGHSLCLKPL